MKITYLLGAGASAEKMPVVERIPKVLEECINKLDNKNNYDLVAIPFSMITDDNNSQTHHLSKKAKPINDDLNKVIEDLRWLLQLSLDHSSIDTAAKKFSIRKELNNLTRLKKSLAIFFLLEQQEKGLDKRYDKFWASILEIEKEGNVLPKNISILTWNYDYQLVASYSNFLSDGYKYQKHQKEFNVTPQKISTLEKGDFFIGYLNGVAGRYTYNNIEEFEWNLVKESNTDINFIELAKNIVEHYVLYNDEAFFNDMCFAWEENDNNNRIARLDINKVAGLISDTDILVIIGYSFPHFNRKTDRVLFKALTKIKKVYVQTKPIDFESSKFILEEYFKIIRTEPVFLEGGRPGMKKSEMIFEVKGLNEFFIPPEF